MRNVLAGLIRVLIGFGTVTVVLWVVALAVDRFAVLMHWIGVAMCSIMVALLALGWLVVCHSIGEGVIRLARRIMEPK